MGKLLGQVKYDIIFEFGRTIKWLIVLLIFIVSDCLALRISIRDLKNVDDSAVGVENYLWKLLGGTEPVELGRKTIKIPMEYLILGIIILMIIVGYVKKEFKTSGYRNILYSGSKSIWLLSKYITTLLKCFSLIIAFWIGMGILAWTEGINGYYFNLQVFTQVLGFNLSLSSYLTDALIVICLSLFAILISYTALDFLLDSIFVMIISCVFLIGSYFVDSVFFPGNNMMLIRTAEKLQSGESIIQLVLPLWMVSVVLVAMSFLIMKKKDIL